MRKITAHVVHCSDSLDGDVKVVRQWHKARGFNDVGYHFVIRRDGEIEVGRTLDVVGAHCQGHNSTTVGTCLIGKDKFEPAQFEALRRIDTMLRSMYPDIKLYGHCELDTHGKTCPCFDVHKTLGR